MCGIIGVASRSVVADRSWLSAARDTMRHRGPDDAGEWWSPEGTVGLGHRRLAIIDLSPSGHQPMVDPVGELVIVFNGEIYNYLDLRLYLESRGHSFRSQSDTEVILVAYREWGNSCIERLNGMFALCIYDSRSRCVLVARDRAGEKPLFYRIQDGTFWFSSELKGLMAEPSFEREIDPVALNYYLAVGYVPAPHCIIKGVRKLPSAHSMVFSLDDGSSRSWQYWQLPAPAETQPVSDDVALEEELVTLLGDAVRRQLVADVPVGVMLSGGVDSSLITAMAARVGANVKTFTVCLPGQGRFDETEHARIIAREFATEHHELPATESRVDLLPLLARQLDEPMIDSSIIPTYLVSKLVREHCTVALGGDGGDELFGGYSHYNDLLWAERNVAWLPQQLRNCAADVAEALLPIGFKGRNWIRGMAADFEAGIPRIAMHFDFRSRRRLLRKDLGINLDMQFGLRTSGDLVARSTRGDFQSYLVEDVLVKVDRASMLNSLEVRAPWLDYRIVEFAFGRVPSRLKATLTDRKRLLKRLAARLLPAEFDLNRKQGFSIPLGNWLQQATWMTYFREVLLGECTSGVFDRRMIAGMLSGQLRGRSNSERLFALVMFELWRREYRVAV